MTDPVDIRSPSGALNDICSGYFEERIVRREELVPELAWICHLSCAIASRAEPDVLPGLFRKYLYGEPPVPVQMVEDWAIHCLAYVGYGTARMALRLLAGELDEPERGHLRASRSEAASLSADALYERGISLYSKLDAERIPAQIKNYSEISSDYYAQVMRLFGITFERPSLSIAQREAATVCVLACAGAEDAQLAFHAKVATKFGLARSDFAEMLVMVQWYAGLPRANNAANLIKSTLASP